MFRGVRAAKTDGASERNRCRDKRQRKRKETNSAAAKQIGKYVSELVDERAMQSIYVCHKAQK